MKKSLKLLSTLILTASIPMAASAQFNEGENVLGLGVGVLGGYTVGWNGSGVSQSPALNFHFDHGMGELGPGTWGLGGYVGYKTISYKENYNYGSGNYSYNYHYSYLVIGARGTWHYNEWHNNKWDTYGGVMLAYRGVSYTDNSDYPSGYPGNSYSYDGSGLGLSVFLGSRYYFSDKFGAYGELGYGLTALQLGVTMKL